MRRRWKMPQVNRLVTQRRRARLRRYRRVIEHGGGIVPPREPEETMDDYEDRLMWVAFRYTARQFRG